MPIYRADKKWFNPLYFILNDICKDETIRTVFVYGGKSSAKTQSICQLLMKEAYVYGKSSLAFRKESTTIPTTIKESFNTAKKTTRLYPAIETQDRKYIVNGSNIVLKGLDDEEKAKGVEGFDYVLIDELNQFDEREYDAFEMSLRGKKGQKIFGTWNPIDEYHWLKVNIIDQKEWVETEWKLPNPDSFVKRSKDGSFILIKTNYLDNYWIAGSPCGTYGYRDEALINRYNEMMKKNYNRYRIEVLGEWGKTTYGGEFLNAWRSEYHVKKVEYDPKLAIWLYFDENTVPYYPCAFIQISANQKELRIIDIIAAKSPNNKTTWMASEIDRKLTLLGHKEAVYIDGDATSQKDDVKQEAGHDMFRLVMNGLQKWKPQRRTSSSNPAVKTSKDFLNSILGGEIPELQIFVDEKCKIAITDFENTKEDKNGKVDKSTVKDPVTKISYQPYGHFCDILRYAAVKLFNKEYDRFVKLGGDFTNIRLAERTDKYDLYTGGANRSRW